MQFAKLLKKDAVVAVCWLCAAQAALAGTIVDWGHNDYVDDAYGWFLFDFTRPKMA